MTWRLVLAGFFVLWGTAEAMGALGLFDVDHRGWAWFNAVVAYVIAATLIAAATAT